MTERPDTPVRTSRALSPPRGAAAAQLSGLLRSERVRLFDDGRARNVPAERP
ncbi:MAG: hypothetical protein WC729_28290 [Sphingomonas sp.]|uniref:hypothetical protein n=1 Tax=Sphingomonas sp. TaxID=28214 RepID=UPI0035629BE2